MSRSIGVLYMLCLKCTLYDDQFLKPNKHFFFLTEMNLWKCKNLHFSNCSTSYGDEHVKMRILIFFPLLYTIWRWTFENEKTFIFFFSWILVFRKVLRLGFLTSVTMWEICINLMYWLLRVMMLFCCECIYNVCWCILYFFS